MKGDCYIDRIRCFHFASQLLANCPFASKGEGLLTLHLESFREMLPFFFRYSHLNYARWGCVYLSEMHQLPPEVEEEFRLGNFVVKGSDQSFNQVDPDHSLEWLNGIGKKSGGIIGITKTNSALARWTLIIQPQDVHCNTNV